MQRSTGIHAVVARRCHGICDIRITETVAAYIRIRDDAVDAAKKPDKILHTAGAYVGG